MVSGNYQLSHTKYGKEKALNAKYPDTTNSAQPHEILKTKSKQTKWIYDDMQNIYSRTARSKKSDPCSNSCAERS